MLRNDRESTALRLARGLWKALLVSGCVGQTEGGCVDEADVPALEQREAWSPSACRLHRMMERLVKDSDGEAAASPGEGPCSDRAGLGRGELQQRAKVMTRFPKGGLGVEGLVEKEPEGALECEDAITAVGPCGFPIEDMVRE